MNQDTKDTLYLVIIFMFLGGCIGAFVMTAITMPNMGTTDNDIERIRQAEKDCTIKEYYYMDHHREFCDRIGVNPQ